jgi:homoserine dehydrogenase
VVVDVTAAEDMEAVALDALGRGWGAVLANKRPLAGRLATFRRLTAGPRLRFEATVGAGLPWIEALGHLLETGDRVLCVEAAVSGTLGFIFSELEAGASFSAAVAEARARGYTEPDPRDDLGAADVRRKALILARLLGLEVEWGDVPAEPLYPGTWDELSVERFMAELPALDAEYGARMATARAAGGTLRYAAVIRDGRCTVGLRHLAAGSPLASLQGAECLLAITSQRYQPPPLVIRGPGAGAEVTAAGVYADIIALGMEL